METYQSSQIRTDTCIWRELLAIATSDRHSRQCRGSYKDGFYGGSIELNVFPTSVCSGWTIGIEGTEHGRAVRYVLMKAIAERGRYESLPIFFCRDAINLQLSMSEFVNCKSQPIVIPNPAIAGDNLGGEVYRMPRLTTTPTRNRALN